MCMYINYNVQVYYINCCFCGCSWLEAQCFFFFSPSFCYSDVLVFVFILWAIILLLLLLSISASVLSCRLTRLCLFDEISKFKGMPFGAGLMHWILRGERMFFVDDGNLT